MMKKVLAIGIDVKGKILLDKIIFSSTRSTTKRYNFISTLISIPIIKLLPLLGYDDISDIDAELIFEIEHLYDREILQDILKFNTYYPDKPNKPGALFCINEGIKQGLSNDKYTNENTGVIFAPFGSKIPERFKYEFAMLYHKTDIKWNHIIPKIHTLKENNIDFIKKEFNKVDYIIFHIGPGMTFDNLLVPFYGKDIMPETKETFIKLLEVIPGFSSMCYDVDEE